MPQSFCQVIIHAVFSTKNRVPVLDADLRPELWALIIGILRENGAHPIRIGGVEDHIHVLYGLGKDLTIPKSISVMKTGSSQWIKSKRPKLSGFHWQTGYGAFSVSPTDVDMIVRYIDKQPEHHVSQSFQEEFRKILTKLGIEFDETYLWD